MPRLFFVLRLAFAAKSLFAFLIVPFLLTGCSQNNVTEDDSLKKYFDSAGVEGSFALLDNKQGDFTIYNLARYRDSAYSPDRTFDIVQSLIAIQTGVLKDADSYIDDSIRSMSIDYGDLNKMEDMDPRTLRKAFQSYYGLNVFASLTHNFGVGTLKKWIDSLHYGNRDTSGGLVFWDYGHLSITPDEELGLIKRLYFDQLPFFPRTQKIVRDIMGVEDNANYTLSYKTASKVTRDGHSIGWVVGWIEENKHPYFFVVNLGSPHRRADMETIGKRVLRDILGEMGFFHGKK